MLKTPQSKILDQAKLQIKDALLSLETPEPFYRGKVRDVFEKGSELLIVATDRVSAFDSVLGCVPFKGAMLTAQATHGLTLASSIVPTHFIENIDPQVMRCKKAKPFAFEMIIRGYLTGSLLREPESIRGKGYGLTIDPSVGPHAAFDTPIITPSTKAEAGEHDLPLSLQDILDRNLCTKKQVETICDYTKALYAQGVQFAQKNGLILVDTKYEFGLVDDEVVLIDEIHTADSSRYWKASSYKPRLDEGKSPEMLDKENLRQALIERGFDPSSGKTPPAISEDLQLLLCERYWNLTETLLGQTFTPPAEKASIRVPRAVSSWI